ncbi:hypothetical protein THAOC_34852 [Thalassiosira oceanica]|uniref:Leucine-rich repeat-containing N-terminal plant-type domain-containing protein n=1 Tax=Thalassiosira oceanica TaxID=159749 RepID=K0RBK9_THAOC|nr:hypothetical protein THAOC_34852 [Thalassiosira oceanica]|eukprot:EJK46476.1 hypothetical protein THAOC_34852 [Thalassiosira oceanica]
MSYSSDEDSIPPPPPPPPPMPVGAAAEEELEIQMTPVLERMIQNEQSSQSKKRRSFFGGRSKSSGGSSTKFQGGQVSSRTEANVAVNGALEFGSPASGDEHDDAPLMRRDPSGKRGGSGRKKCCLIGIVAFLLVGGGVGAALGVLLTRKDSGDGGGKSSSNEAVGQPGAEPAPTPIWMPTEAVVEAPAPSIPATPAIPATEAPTEESEEDRKMRIALSVLATNIPQSYDDVTNDRTETPQRDALRWVLVDPYPYDWDALELSPPDAKAELDLVQRYVLATFFYATNFRASWASDDYWLSEENVCQWHGIVCDGGDSVARGRRRRLGLRSDRGLQDDLTGVVTELKFKEGGLDGFLPEDLGALTSLERIVMHRNRLRGFIGLGKVYAAAPNTPLRLIHVRDNVYRGEAALIWADLALDQQKLHDPGLIPIIKLQALFLRAYLSASCEPKKGSSLEEGKKSTSSPASSDLVTRKIAVD